MIIIKSFQQTSFRSCPTLEAKRKEIPWDFIGSKYFGRKTVGRLLRERERQRETEKELPIAHPNPQQGHTGVMGITEEAFVHLTQQP